MFHLKLCFCHSIFRVYCHVWVKLCAEQLRGFCTSRSPFGCGKLPLQLVISQFDMPPLYLYIIIPFTRITIKIPQWQNQSAKLATTKHITHLTMEKTQMHGAWNDTVQCSQWGQKEPHKAKLLQDAPFSKQKHCHTAHIAQKQASLYGMRYP